jgi:thyroxine 5-deiodinase
MGALERFAALVYGPYAGRVDSAVVYLEEAHPTDGWMYGGVEHLLPQAKELPQRLAAARILADKLDGLAAAHNTQSRVRS